MKKMTLLEMVQNISSALELDEINSITDTTEALQIAEVIKETFYEQFNNIFIAEFQRLFAFESVSSLISPNYLKVPSDVSKVLWVRYADFRAGGVRNLVTYMPPEDFLQMQFQNVGPDASLTQVTDPTSGVTYYIPTNAPPTLFTMFDDEYIAFNSVDDSYETTLSGSNSVGYGTKSFEFELSDEFIPPLDGNLFPLLLSEAKSTCFINQKQVSSTKEEQRSRRQRVRMQNDQHKARRAQYAYWSTGNNFARHR